MGIVLKNKFELLSATKTASENGAAVKLLDNSEGFFVSLEATGVGGTTPTFDIAIEHSQDGTSWYALTSFTQVIADATELKTLTGHVMEYVRYTLTVTGTAPTAILDVNFMYNNIRLNQ